MCDTLYKFKKEFTLFAKNSDREPDEAQYVEYYPHLEFRDKLRATYIEVDHGGEVNSVVISRPYWMWGAEMGVNEKGVAIGNEAIFSKKKRKEKRLLGMDLLRLGLEMGNSAREAADVMSEYLERYGIGGSNSIRTALYYDNSFLIADRNEGYILETEGREHQIQKIEGSGSISNFPRLRKYRLDILYSTMGQGVKRQILTSAGLRKIDEVENAFSLMRSHHSGFTHPRNGSNGDICMHGGYLSRRDQTANSFVVELRDDESVIWSTFSNNPCISIYSPLIFKKGILYGTIPEGKSFWNEKALEHLDLSLSTPKAFNGFQRMILGIQNDIVARFQPMREDLSKGGIPDQNRMKEFDGFLKDVLSRISDTSKISGRSISMYNLWIRRQAARLHVLEEPKPANQ